MPPILACHLRNPLVLSLICVPKERFRHIGISNVSVDELRRARRLVPIVTVQNRYNYADRSSEEVLRECEREGITFLPWYPLRGNPN
jgi:aryl-alcohol dehydrogenase-like predicted oxidoreductase